MYKLNRQSTMAVGHAQIIGISPYYYCDLQGKLYCVPNSHVPDVDVEASAGASDWFSYVVKLCIFTRKSIMYFYM